MALRTFPTLAGISWPVKRSLIWSTDKQDSLSGKRIRLQRFSYPLYGIELTFDFLRIGGAFNEREQLLGFIKSVGGPALLWQFTDVDDSVATAQDFGEGDGTTVAFQLTRSLGGFGEPVFLVNGAPQIFVGGVLKTVNTDYTISAYGVVTFVVAPTNGALLTWTGNYFWPCRFDEDVTEFVKAMQGLDSLPAIKFSTEKLP